MSGTIPRFPRSLHFPLVKLRWARKKKSAGTGEASELNARTFPEGRNKLLCGVVSAYISALARCDFSRDLYCKLCFVMMQNPWLWRADEAPCETQRPDGIVEAREYCTSRGAEKILTVLGKAGRSVSEDDRDRGVWAITVIHGSYKNRGCSPPYLDSVDRLPRPLMKQRMPCVRNRQAH